MQVEIYKLSEEVKQLQDMVGGVPNLFYILLFKRIYFMYVDGFNWVCNWICS